MRIAEIKESLFEKLMKKQKNKKVYSSRCDLGASMECKPISEHSIRSDYWHIYPLSFFIFRPLLSKLNSNGKSGGFSQEVVVE